jgi:hypothetical protein
MYCTHCGCELEREGDLLVDAENGDDGGTYDYCPSSDTNEHQEHTK